MNINMLKKNIVALASVAQWIEYWPVNRKVAVSIPSQSTCLSCRSGNQSMYLSHIDVSLPPSPSLPLSLKINK